MRREVIEDDYRDATVYINCKLNSKGLLVGGRRVMDKGKVLDWDWWEAKVKYGKHIHKKKIIM